MALYQFIKPYCLENHIAPAEVIFPRPERVVQKQLHIICDYLGIQNIETHSSRKFYAIEICRNSGYNITLVQHLLQHSSIAVMQRYIGIQQRTVEQAIEGRLKLNI